MTSDIFSQLNIDASNPWFTHAPHLLDTCINLASQPGQIKILEIGMGDGSSKVFSYIAKNYSNVHITSIETNPAWFDKCYNTFYKDVENVNCILYDSFENKYTSLIEEFDLIFVDQGSWEDRNKSINQFIKQTKCFVVHDYDYIANHWPDTHALLKNTFPYFNWIDEPNTESTLICKK